MGSTWNLCNAGWNKKTEMMGYQEEKIFRDTFSRRPNQPDQSGTSRSAQLEALRRRCVSTRSVCL